MLDINKRMIGSFQLEDYQAEAIEKMYQVINDILIGHNDTKEVLLHAPVGSGKTVMGAFLVNFMKERMSEFGIDVDFSFFWISPDRGGINQQSKETFDEIIRDVDTIDIQEALSQEGISSNQILFINWERIGKKGNKLMEDSEGANFYDITKGVEGFRVLIIDEAHQNWEKGGGEAISLIKPDLTIHLTATPDKRLRSLPDENKVFISYKSSQDAGVIKKQIRYNDGIDEDENFEEDKKRNSNHKIDLLDIEQKIILKAMEKRNYLERLIKETNNKYIKPLVIIQIPDANAIEKITSDYVLDFLERQGIEDDKIAIWLSNNKRNIENLPSSSVEYIITKQAITTGWDCPRAHILVKLRQTKSQEFDLQTLGRIMRIPRGYDFSHKDLNTAYVYSPHKQYEYSNKEEKSDIDKLIEQNKHSSFLKEEFKEEIGVLGIPMYKANKIKEIYIDSELLYDYLKEELYNIDLNSIDSDKAFIDIKAEEKIDINEENLDKSIKLDEGISKLLMSFNDLRRHFKTKMNGYSKITDIGYFVSRIILDAIGNEDENFEESYRRLYTVYYNAEDQIDNAIKTAIDKYRKDDEIVREVSSIYEVVEKVYLGEIKDNTSEVYSYDKEPDKGEYDSKPEEKFGVFLNNNKNKLKYWFKNQAGKEHFSITYEHDNMIKEYYPDFIIFDNKRNVYILDTKANFGDDDFEDTSIKYEQGVKYKEMKSVKEKIKELGFNKLYFSMIKYSDNNSTTPYILLQDKWSDNIKDWVKFEDILNK